MTAPIVDERVSAIIACAGGGPRASGRGPLAFKATLATAQAIIEGTESVFVRHGEKVLRSNCGGILAKDETYGFAFVDLMYGLLAPRGPDKGCAIPLGEKLRKLNKKRADEYSAKRRAAGKLAAETSERRAWRPSRLGTGGSSARSAPPSWHRLSPPPPAVLPSSARRSSARTPPPPPQRLHRCQRPQSSRCCSSCSSSSFSSQRGGQCGRLWPQRRPNRRSNWSARCRSGIGVAPPNPPPRRRIDPARDSEDYIQAMDAQEAARGAYMAAWHAYRCECDQIDGMFQSLSLLLRDEEAAREAVDAAEDAYEQYLFDQSERAELEAENLRLKMSLLELQEREANAPIRAAVAAKAVAAWGPDHASHPPTAVYDLRGPLQPVPPPEQLADGSWKGGRVPAVMPKQA